MAAKYDGSCACMLNSAGARSWNVWNVSVSLLQLSFHCWLMSMPRVASYSHFLCCVHCLCD